MFTNSDIIGSFITLLKKKSRSITDDLLYLLIPVPVSPSSSGGGAAGGGSGTALYPGATSHPLSSLLSQQRLLELSRFGLRHYDIAHHVLSQQGAVTKLLGKQAVLLCIFFILLRLNIKDVLFDRGRTSAEWAGLTG